MFSFFGVFFRVVCWGLCLSACYLLRPALSVLVCRALFGLCAFFVVFLWCCGVVLAFGCCCFFLLGCFARLCFCGVELLRFGPLSPGFAPPLTCPPPWLVLWCLLVQSFSAGPSLRVSGCICDGPVVMPVVWCVVTAWLLSSLLLMATKASALWDFALYTMLRVFFRCLSFLH